MVGASTAAGSGVSPILRPVAPFGPGAMPLEDPLVAAVRRSSAEPSFSRQGWTVVDSSGRDDDFAGPLWVQRLVPKQPVLPAMTDSDAQTDQPERRRA